MSGLVYGLLIYVSACVAMCSLQDPSTSVAVASVNVDGASGFLPYKKVSSVVRYPRVLEAKLAGQM